MASRVLRHARRRAGLTQRALAAKSGIPQETIARIEAERVDPRVRTLGRLLEACGWGLEVMPRPGIGHDRSVIRNLIRLDEPSRARWLEESAAGVRELRQSMKRL